MQNRIIWIDWAKAILIYLMVVGHCFPVDWENQLIYAFHMPAFFIISGYLYRPHHWLKTLKSFLIPIIFFSAINLTIYTLPKIIKGTFNSEHLVERILMPFWASGSLPEELYIYCFPGVWFIISLLLCRLLMGDIRWFSWVPKYKYYVLAAILLLLSIEPFVLPENPLIPYKFYRFFPSMPFVLFGYCLKDRLNLSKITVPKVFFFLFLFVIVTFVNGYSNILNYEFGRNYLVFFVAACAGSLVLYKMCSLLNNNSVIRVLSTGTMLVLAMNFNLKICFSVLFTKLGFDFMLKDQYFYPWVVAVLIIAICYVPIKWLLKYCPILLGK